MKPLPAIPFLPSPLGGEHAEQGDSTGQCFSNACEAELEMTSVATTTPTPLAPFGVGDALNALMARDPPRKGERKTMRANRVAAYALTP